MNGSISDMLLDGVEELQVRDASMYRQNLPDDQVYLLQNWNTDVIGCLWRSTCYRLSPQTSTWRL